MASTLDTVLNNLRKSYADALPEKLSQLKQLWGQKNADELRKAAHKMKGSGLSYGFPEVTEICTRMESAAELEDWLEVGETIDNLSRIIENL